MTKPVAVTDPEIEAEMAALNGITVSEGAARRIKELQELEGKPDLMLRIRVSGGGCAGFQYGMGLDDTVNDDDRIFEGHGVKVVVDEVSLDLVKGSELNYIDDLIGAYFALSNPNANSTCGCGSSFSL